MALDLHLGPGQILGGRYRLVHELGRGGMGVVWRGEHLGLQRGVAIKVLPPELTHDASMVARLRREALAVSRLAHPSVVAALDFGVHQGAAYLVMELVEGDTLTHVLAREGKIALPRALRLIRQVAGALEAAHSVRIVHRDLKPSNVLVAPGERGELAKLIDFGLATFREGDGDWQRQTAAGLILGTPAYMAPEQFTSSNPPSPAADVYALGVTLFEMLTGHLPFAAPTLAGLLVAHLQQPVPSLRAHLPGVEVGAIDGLLASLLAKDPAVRLRDGGDILRAIDRLDTGWSISDRLLQEQEGVLLAVGPAEQLEAVTRLPMFLTEVGAFRAQRIGAKQLLVVPHAEAALHLASLLHREQPLRIAVHPGVFERLGTAVYGEPVRSVLRLARAARQGEILLSEELHDAVGYGWLARIEPSGHLQFRDEPSTFQVFRFLVREEGPLPVRPAAHAPGGLVFACTCGQHGFVQVRGEPEGKLRIRCPRCSQYIVLDPTSRDLESIDATVLSQVLLLPRPPSPDDALMAALADED
jgi:class 3 adenylate cyclase